MSNPEHSYAEPQTAIDVQSLTADGLVTVDEGAQFLAVGRTTIYAAMSAGELPWVQIGRARRIPKRALIEYAESKLTGGWARQSFRPNEGAPQVVEMPRVGEPYGHVTASLRAQR